MRKLIKYDYASDEHVILRDGRYRIIYAGKFGEIPEKYLDRYVLETRSDKKSRFKTLMIIKEI